MELKSYQKKVIADLTRYLHPKMKMSILIRQKFGPYFFMS